MSTAAKPLDGVRVIDISSSYAAPTTSMYLADMGADVIKVEPLRGDDAREWGPPFINGESAWFLSVNRNKRSLCLDIRTQSGRDLLFTLLETADVFIENLNPSKLEKHGLGLAELQRRFPRMVICAFSGFGLDGPDAPLPGYDLIAQARSGLMSVTGADGVPQRVSTALSDVAAGTVGAFAVAAALVRQQRTGSGEVVDVSLLQADLAFLSPRIASFLAGDDEPKPCAGTDSVVAIYQSMRTADRPIVVAVGNDGHWRRACQALGLEHLLERDDLASNAGRRANRSEVVDAFQSRLEALPSHEALKLMQDAGIPCAPINTLSEVLADPQVEARHAIVEYEHPVAGAFQGVGSPWKLGSQGRQSPEPAPLRGQHGHEILTEIGLDNDQIAGLQKEQAIWIP